jgi:hypothetical protein
MEFSTSSSLGGRRSAYLVIANFVFLAIVLGFVLFSSHAQSQNFREESRNSTPASASQSVDKLTVAEVQN